MNIIYFTHCIYTLKKATNLDKPQACNHKRCKTCPMMFDNDANVIVNNIPVTLNPDYNCKSKNVIYLLQCKICETNSNNTYVGQTRQECHNRINGHRQSLMIIRKYLRNLEWQLMRILITILLSVYQTLIVGL